MVMRRSGGWAVWMLCFFGFAAAAGSALAQLPELLVDINTTPNPPQGSSSPVPTSLLPVGGRLLISTSLGLWTSDGTDPGSRALFPPLPSGVPVLVVRRVGPRVVLAETTYESLRFWATDGTSAGTQPLTPTFESGLYEARYFLHGEVAGRLWLSVCLSSLACELWSTDGTPDGTGRLEGLRTPDRFESHGDRAFFISSDEQGTPVLAVTDGTFAGTRFLSTLETGVTAFSVTSAGAFLVAGPMGNRVWTSNGTVEGTRLLAEFEISGCFSGRFCRDDPHSYPEHFEPVPSGVVFEADGGPEGVELWFADGSDTGTRRLSDLPPRFVPQAQHTVWLGDRWLFVATEGRKGAARLFTSNGDPASTTGFKACGDGGCRFERFMPDHPALLGRRLYSVYSTTGNLELWGTDGTARGTARVSVIGPANSFSNAASASWHFGRLYFLVDTADDPPRLWVSDGTAAGTHVLLSGVFALAPFRGEVYLNAVAEETSAVELWRTSGLTETTHAAVRLGKKAPGSHPLPVRLGTKVLLFVNSSSNDGKSLLWSSAGTVESTVPIPGLFVDPATDGHPLPGLTVGERHYFTVLRAGSNNEIWVTDGTASGTSKVGEVPSGPFAKTDWNGQLLFLAANTERCEVWSSDGSANGTRRLFEVPPPLRCPTGISAHGPDFLFTSRVGTAENAVPQLFKSNGTVEGLVQLSAQTEAAESTPPLFTRVGNTVFFVLKDAGGAARLWATDGSDAGTRLLPGFEAPSDLFAFGDSLVFATASADFERPRALWRLDATTFEATALGDLGPFIADVEFGPSPWPTDWTACGDRFCFVGQDPEHGRELWSTDGTAAGTTRVVDLEPGPASSSPYELVASEEGLYFAAFERDHGNELWRLGAGGAVELALDLWPGPLSAAPAELTVLGGRLIFVADDGLSGRELWMMPLTRPVPACGLDPTKLCLGGGRFAVEVQSPGVAAEAPAAGTRLSETSAAFTFFSPRRPDLYVKLLDGTGVNGHHWFFLGGMTERELTITLTDTQTGARRRYVSPGGLLTAWADLHSFGPEGAHGLEVTRIPSSKASETWTRSAIQRSPGPPCEAGPTRLCLEGGRFAAELFWRKPDGLWFSATAVTLGGRNGWFWFDRPDRVELGLSLRRRPVSEGGGFGVVWSALTTNELELRVTDTTTGEARVYTKPRGSVASHSDPQAFE